MRLPDLAKGGLPLAGERVIGAHAHLGPMLYAKMPDEDKRRIPGENADRPMEDWRLLT